MKDIQYAQQSNKILTYSYNPQVTSTLTKEQGGQITKGWISGQINWDQQELDNFVKTTSYLPSKLTDGHKLKKNVEELYFLTLDFDKGNPTMQQYISTASQSQFSWFLHTTVNHQKSITDEGVSTTARDKYRVIIPLDRSISIDELTEIKKVLLERYRDLDKTSFDGNRYFKMNPDAITHLNNFTDADGNILFLDPDVLLEEKKMSWRQLKKQLTISLNDEITLEDGFTHIKVREVTEKTPIFCPFCDHTTRTHPYKDNAFIDINAAGQYYIFCSSEGITYWQDSSEIDASKSKLFWNTSTGCPSQIDYKSYNGDGPLYLFKNNGDFENYCAQNNIDVNIRQYLPRREIIFNPGLPGGLNHEYYNIFQESEYMKKDYSMVKRISLQDIISELQSRTKVIYPVLKNIFGKDEYLERFLNWLAHILQSRQKSYTAWLITSNVQGIGKDLMFIRMLMPLFGEKQSQLMNGSRIARNFNKIDMNCWLRGYNEVFSAGNSKENLHRKESLKDLITAPYQSIEIKGVDTFQTHNFINFILFSNSEHPIFLDEEDRRFNVIRNEDAKKVSELPIYSGLANLEPDIAADLHAFADILFTLNFDLEQANTPIDTDAKDRLKTLSKDDYQEFAEKLKDRDAGYFMLGEVFPMTDSDKALLKPDIAQQVIDLIATEGIIPATYMSKICRYHFQHQNYKTALKRLKLKGIEETTKRITGITMKVYECK